MKRAHLLTGMVVLIGALMALTPSGGDRDSIGARENLNTGNKPERGHFDPQATALYQRRQKELGTALKAYFEKAIASGEIVGAGVSIVRGDSIVVSEGYGERSTDGHAPVDGQTIFRLGSLSKGFTGISLPT